MFEVMQAPPPNFDMFVDRPKPDDKQRKKARKLVHLHQDWHRSVHLWIVDPFRKSVVLQKRSPEKDTFPNCWDISVAGHLEYGDGDSRETGVREAQEELGISPTPQELEFCFTCPAEQAPLGGCNCYEDVYIIQRDASTFTFTAGPAEVTDVKWIEIEELKRCWEEQHQEYVPRVKPYREAFFSKLDEICNSVTSSDDKKDEDVSADDNIVIVGGGPAGLLLGILLASKVKTLLRSVTILEQSEFENASVWSNEKSYSINLNQTGLGALEYAGVLEGIKEIAMERQKVIMEMSDGQRKEIPKIPSNYAVSRPDLIRFLENHIKQNFSDIVTVRRGVGVTSVVERSPSSSDNGGGAIELTFADGTTMTCSHVVAADGKWSVVRESLPDWKNMFQVTTEEAFGISVSTTANPERWHRQATTVFRPKSSDKYYVIAAPLVDKRYSISIVCYTQINQDHPLLTPRDESSTQQDWNEAEDDNSSSEQSDKLARMLQDDLPLFYQDLWGTKSQDIPAAPPPPTTQINRRISWLKPLVDNPTYASQSGRVLLVGDAAHSMTPSIGEGCNTALSSAESLVKQLLLSLSESSSERDTILRNAFLEYGKTRPAEVIPIQLRSAQGNRYKAK